MRAINLSIATAALAGILLAGCSNATSELPRHEQTAGGMTIELGVLPAEIIQGNTSAEGALHGETPQPNSGSHHLVVALFDARSGARITNARIRAGVGDRAHNHEPDQWLAPMQIAGAMSYGGLFLMQGEGPWRIHLEIYRPGSPKPIDANFAYEHPGGP